MLREKHVPSWRAIFAFLLFLNVLNVNPPANAQAQTPRITRISPSRISQGASGTILRILGEGLTPGLIITAADDTMSSPGFRFTPVQTLNSRIATTVISVNRNARLGHHSFYLVQNFGNFNRVGNFIIEVVPGHSLTAAASVTSVVVVQPRHGALIDDDRPIYPHALLSTTGSGSITGFWEVDGVPFDRFTVRTQGGYPVQVKSKTPLPFLAEGLHRLACRVDSPQRRASEKVDLIYVSHPVAYIRLIEPADKADISFINKNEKHTFNWTPQPAATGYEVSICSKPEQEECIFKKQVHGTRWLMERSILNELRPETYWWNVRPVYAGPSVGAPSEWRQFVITSTSSFRSSPSPGKKIRGFRSFGISRGNGAGARFAGVIADSYAGQFQNILDGRNQSSESITDNNPANKSDWRVDGSVMLDWFEGSAPEGPDTVTGLEVGGTDSAQLTSSGSIFRRFSSVYIVGTGDLSLLQELSGGNRFIQESRNFSIQARMDIDGFQASGMIGYFGPTAAAGSRLLDFGLPRIGPELDLNTAVGRFSAYGTLDGKMSSLSSSVLGPSQDILLFSYSPPLPESAGSIRLVAMDVDDPGSEEWNISPTESRSYGIIGTYPLMDTWSINAEIATSNVEPQDLPEAKGTAYHFGVNGNALSTDISVEILHTEKSFANPATGPLSSSGIPDRTSLDFKLGRPVGQGFANLDMRYARSRKGEDEIIPAAGEHLIDLSWYTPLGTRVALSLAGSYVRDRSDETVYSPEFIVRNVAAGMSLNGVWGKFQLDPSLSWNSTRNEGGPGAELGDSDVWYAGLISIASVRNDLRITGQASWTRIAPRVGENSSTTYFNVQPEWFLNSAGIQIAPLLAMTWNEVPYVGTERRSQARIAGAFHRNVGRRHTFRFELSFAWNEIRLPDTEYIPGGKWDDTGLRASISWNWTFGPGSSYSLASPGYSQYYRGQPWCLADNLNRIGERISFTDPLSKATKMNTF